MSYLEETIRRVGFDTLCQVEGWLLQDEDLQTIAYKTGLPYETVELLVYGGPEE